MLGSIIGDVISSVYECSKTKEIDFLLFSEKTKFTDDTVLTIATAYAIIKKTNFGSTYKIFVNDYPDRGYGGKFRQWMKSASLEPYDSWSNGSAMRVGSIGFAFNSIEEVLAEAKRSVACTHNHPEGIKGAQAIALVIYLARMRYGKLDIKKMITHNFGYDLDRTIDEIRPDYAFNGSCQETVPEAIIAFLDSTDFESTIRLAISLGGDSDTLACIVGGIAEAYYNLIPMNISEPVVALLSDEFQQVIVDFYKYLGEKN